MSEKSIIRDNIALNANSEGCRQVIVNQIHELKELENISSDGLNVLIIGGSSGYGLASRIALTYKANAYTYNVSFEREPRKRSSGSAGYYNNLHFNELAKSAGFTCDDLNGDAFSHEVKDEVITHFKNLNKKIDLVIYSLASGVKFDPDTKEKYVSSLKPINQSYTGLNVDIANEVLKSETLSPASDLEIESTVKVMGGDDYKLWAKRLLDADVLNDKAKFITYTYLGSDITESIYKDGTIGIAKRHLEKSNEEVNEMLKVINGEALISSSKAVVTKASVFIPTMVLYVSGLFKVMKEENVHESIVKHKYRLFKDMVYGDKRLLDENNLLRLDAFELDENIQNKVKELLSDVNEDNFKDTVDFKSFKKEFLNINGFDVD